MRAVAAQGSVCAACAREGTQASVRFGLSLTARAGKLTGLLVDGDASASLEVTLTWNAAGST